MRRGAYVVILGLSALACDFASAAPSNASCRNPNALGTSRTIAAPPAEFSRIGTLQYNSFPQLPLKEREVVITFDDGPLPATTPQILDTLAAECVRATFFMIGRQAAAHPELARKVAAAGHTVGTHSQNHPLTFDQMPIDRVRAEIDDGIKSVGDALGERNAVAPYFRIPGLLRVAPVEEYVTSRNIAIWSADFDAEDWYRNATPQDIVRKALSRLEAKGKGVLLLHDVHPATAMALPDLLRELKTRGFKVVAVVPRIESQKPVAEHTRGRRAEQYDRYERGDRRDRSGWPTVIRTAPPQYRYYR